MGGIMEFFEKIDLNEYKPLRDIVFESLRKAIMNGDLKPGERLMEIQLAQKLGVSRTPVREAIRKLELEGLVIMVARKGAYVADLSLNDIMDVLEVRASLEGLGAYLAAQKMTDQDLKNLKEKADYFEEAVKAGDREHMIEGDAKLHEIIFKAASNTALQSIVDSLREQVQRFRVTYIRTTQNPKDIVAEHKVLVEAILARDAKAARKAAEAHIKKMQEFINNQMETEDIEEAKEK